MICLALAAATAAAGGCQGKRPTRPTTLPTTYLTTLTPPTPLDTVQAVVTPPLGWRAEPLKRGSNTIHQVWLSPSGHTAFGVIHFSTPIPVSANFLLPFYMRAWRKDQGEATLLHKVEDPSLPGLRFVAEGGLYRTWSNLITSGRQGWSVYAGTLRAHEVNQSELELAEQAREQTQVGLPSND